MSPKTYTPERLNELAVDSATKMTSSLLEGGHLTCEYMRDEESTSLKWSDHVKFRWRIESAGYNDSYETTTRCDNVPERGVKFPERWRTALQCLKLHDRVHECAGDAMDLGASNVTCELLALAKNPRDDRIGKAVAPNDNGSRVVYLLCGHIEHDDWMLHNVSHVDDQLDSNPFQEKDLVIKDIVKDAWDVTQRKRLRTNSHMNVLRGYAQANDYLWCEIVAVAQFRAEEIRSRRHHQELDKDYATRYFERNPFLWESHGERNSHTRLIVLWPRTRGEIYRQNNDACTYRQNKGLTRATTRTQQKRKHKHNN